MRERAALVTEMGEARLEMKRHRIVNGVTDPAAVEVSLQAIPIGDPNHELVEDVPPPRWLDGQHHLVEQSEIGKHPGVARRVRRSGSAPRRQARRLHAKDRRLDPVHPKLAAGRAVVVVSPHPRTAARARPASAASLVVSRPASPKAPRLLLGKKEKHPSRPSPPTGRDS